MIKVQCPICEFKFEIPKVSKIGERVTCPNCFAQLGLHKQKDEYVLGCAFCKELVFDAQNCEECERRHEKRKQIIEEGRL
jgi:C4-type Zn-finger protein